MGAEPLVAGGKWGLVTEPLPCGDLCIFSKNDALPKPAAQVA